MPIYMDRHDLSETVTAENVAQLHKQDLNIQHKFRCRGLTYWFDENRKTAFCLIEAPDKQAIKDMHKQAHGDVPHKIIEVDASIVESFLERIEDPEKSRKTELNIINDPAFRTLMVIGFKLNSLSINELNRVKSLSQKYKLMIAEIIKHFDGRIVNQNDDCFLVSFKSVSGAVLCAIEAYSKYHEQVDKADNKIMRLKIGSSAGVPVTEKGNIFEGAVKLAERMFSYVNSDIVLTTEVTDLFKSENLNVFIQRDFFRTLTKSEETFLNLLIDFTKQVCNNTNVKVDEISKQLGFSKSQLYRIMISITGKSPNTFLREYRLNEALKLLNRQKGNVSEIAFETGFGSLSYFSKCFHNRYGLLPSDYLHAK